MAAVADWARLHRGQRKVARQRDDGGRDVYIHHWYLRVDARRIAGGAVGVGHGAGVDRLAWDGIQDPQGVLLGADRLLLEDACWRHGRGSGGRVRRRLGLSVVKYCSGHVHARGEVAHGFLHDGAFGDIRGREGCVSPSGHDAGRL